MPVHVVQVTMQSHSATYNLCWRHTLTIYHNAYILIRISNLGTTSAAVTILDEQVSSVQKARVRTASDIHCTAPPASILSTTRLYRELVGTNTPTTSPRWTYTAAAVRSADRNRRRLVGFPRTAPASTVTERDATRVKVCGEDGAGLHTWNSGSAVEVTNSLPTPLQDVILPPQVKGRSGKMDTALPITTVLGPLLPSRRSPLTHSDRASAGTNHQMSSISCQSCYQIMLLLRPNHRY